MLSNVGGSQRLREREVVARRAIVGRNCKSAVIVALRLLMPTDCIECYSGAIERFDVLRMPFEDGAERYEGFCMLLSPEHDLREANLTIDIAGRYRKRLAKRGLCSVEVAVAHERAPEIDLGLRCGRLTFRDPPIDICCV